MSHRSQPLLRAYVATRTLCGSMTQLGRHVHRGQRGEGVISAAIAVLIMAFIGAGMWLAFDRMFNDTTDRTQDQVELIGR